MTDKSEAETEGAVKVRDAAIEACEKQALTYLNGPARTVYGQAYQAACRDCASAIAALTAAPAPALPEPTGAVAWRVVDSFGEIRFGPSSYEEDMEDRAEESRELFVQPLYAHPPAAEARIAELEAELAKEREYMDLLTTRMLAAEAALGKAKGLGDG